MKIITPTEEQDKKELHEYIDYLLEQNDTRP